MILDILTDLDVIIALYSAIMCVDFYIYYSIYPYLIHDKYSFFHINLKYIGCTFEFFSGKFIILIKIKLLVCEKIIELLGNLPTESNVINLQQ